MSSISDVCYAMQPQQRGYAKLTAGMLHIATWGTSYERHQPMTDVVQSFFFTRLAILHCFLQNAGRFWKPKNYVGLTYLRVQHSFAATKTT